MTYLTTCTFRIAMFTMSPYTGLRAAVSGTTALLASEFAQAVRKRPNVLLHQPAVSCNFLTPYIPFANTQPVTRPCGQSTLLIFQKFQIWKIRSLLKYDPAAFFPTFRKKVVLSPERVEGLKMVFEVATNLQERINVDLS